MKNLTKIVSVLLLVLIAAFFITSCSGEPASGGGGSNNDTTDISGESTGAGGDSALVGTWTKTQDTSDMKTYYDVEEGISFTFGSDGSFSYESAPGKWDASEGILTFTIDYSQDFKITDITVEATQLTMTGFYSTWICTRDSGTADDIEGTWTVTTQDGEAIDDEGTYTFIFKDGKFAFVETYTYTSLLDSETKSYSSIMAGSYTRSGATATASISSGTQKTEYKIDGTTLTVNSYAQGYEIFTKQ